MSEWHSHTWVATVSIQLGYCVMSQDWFPWCQSRTVSMQALCPIIIWGAVCLQWMFPAGHWNATYDRNVSHFHAVYGPWECILCYWYLLKWLAELCVHVLFVVKQCYIEREWSDRYPLNCSEMCVCQWPRTKWCVIKKMWWPCELQYLLTLLLLLLLLFTRHYYTYVHIVKRTFIQSPFNVYCSCYSNSSCSTGFLFYLTTLICHLPHLFCLMCVCVGSQQGGLL